MSYEWNPQKNVSNYHKHGIDFADAVAVLEDEYALWQEDDGEYNETRFAAVGMDHLAQIVTVIFTFRGEHIRLISARYATNYEREIYESNRK